jgi:F0F1-type ATP synthase membrane subunit a
MVLIEIIRQLIRPITLSVRLAANLTAGHLILSLLASLSFVYRVFSQIPLIILEILVALVQPFVFCILLYLYFSEN